jgi:hypothetical protein
MNGKTPDQIAGWLPCGKVADEMLEEGFQESVKVYTEKGNTAALKALELERKGGYCMYCDKPYKLVEVKNRFSDMAYYEPTCKCYKRCPACGRFMVEERFRNLVECLNCYGEPRPKKEIKTKGRSPAYRDGKMAAAGEEK